MCTFARQNEPPSFFLSTESIDWDLDLCVYIPHVRSFVGGAHKQKSEIKQKPSNHVPPEAIIYRFHFIWIPREKLCFFLGKRKAIRPTENKRLDAPFWCAIAPFGGWRGGGRSGCRMQNVFNDSLSFSAIVQGPGAIGGGTKRSHYDWWCGINDFYYINLLASGRDELLQRRFSIISP